MSVRIRALIFSTFFGSFLAVSLLIVSLTTNNWVKAYPKRANSTDANGEVSYGLFYGEKNLNHGFGVRTHSVNVYSLAKSEPNVMNFWLWLITILGTSFGLLSSALAGILAVIKAAAAEENCLAMFTLVISNVSSMTTQIIAAISWLVQFLNYFRYNALPIEDHRFQWYSEGYASLGYSYYLVIISILVVLYNILILFYIRLYDKYEQSYLEPVVEEKNQGAIMLY